MCLHKVFFFIQLSGTVTSWKRILLMPVGFYHLWFTLVPSAWDSTVHHLKQNRCNYQDQDSPKVSQIPSPCTWDRYPHQLSTISFEGSREEKPQVSKAEEGLFSCSLCTHTIGESRGRVGRCEEEITCLFPPLSRYPLETTPFLCFSYSSGSSGLTNI